MFLQRVDDCHSCEKKIMESVMRSWGSSQLIIVGYWSHSGVLMFERMKIQGVYFFEGDDLHRSFLQENGGDCSFLAIQFMFKSTRMTLVLCWLRVLMEEKLTLSRIRLKNLQLLFRSKLILCFLVLGEELASGCFFLMKLELKERFRMHQRNES